MKNAPSHSSRRSTQVGRKRRAAGWTLLALSVLVAGAWVASGRWAFYVKLADPYRYYLLNTGHIYVYRWAEELAWRAGFDRPWEITAERRDDFSLQWTAVSEADVMLHEMRPDEYRYINLYVLTYFNIRGAPVSQAIWRVAAWPIPLLLWIPAALLLRSGILARRRSLKGMCTKCGYSLAGLGADAPCPECGKNAAPA